MNDASDEQLVWGFRQSGEMRHLDQLVSRHIGKVRAMVYPVVLNHADADEVTQEVFIRMTKGIGGFHQKAQFSTWLYRITMNAAYSFLKQRSRRQMDPQDDLPEHPDHAPGPAESLMASEADTDMGRALAELPPSLRSAITLTVIQGMNVKEAAQIENCLVATMYWRIHEARRQLKKNLRKHMER